MIIDLTAKWSYSIIIRPTHGELFTISVAALDQLNNAVFSSYSLGELPENSSKSSRLGSVI